MKYLARSMTAQEFGRLPENGMRQELMRGEVREIPPPRARHGVVTAKINGELDAFVENRGLGRVFVAGTGFLLERDPDTVRAPDCAFVRAARLPAVIPSEYLPLAPDLAVATISPDDRPGAVREKAAFWIAAGVRLLWVIDPGRLTVTVHRPGASPRLLTDGDRLAGEDVLPGFELEVSRLWQ